MKVNVKCYATLSDPGACNYKEATSIALGKDSVAGDAASRLNIPENDIKLLFVNGRRAKAETRLVDGDTIGLFPPVGGM